MTWHHPLALLLLLAAPTAAALFAWAARRRQEALGVFAARGPAAAVETAARRRRWQAALAVGAVALLAVAAAGPRYGTALREIQQEGVDLVVALDVSESMRAEDVAPSRLARAKFEVAAVLDELRGSRVGLALFAGEAFLQCPLTTDFGAVRLFLDAAAPDLVPTQGTDFARALQVATEAFDVAADGAEGEAPRARVLLVVSDGEDHADGVGEALDAAEDAGLAIFAAGVGEAEGAPIPVYRGGRLAGYKSDRAGATVSSRLEERALRRLAAAGAYYRIGRDGGDLGAFPDALDRLDRGALGSDQFEAFAEQYQWPLALALVLLAAGLLLELRRPEAALA